MNINGNITVKAPRATVFDKLVDAPFFASCVEGVQDLTEVDARRYFAVMETKLAYMRFKFKLAIEVVDIVPPDRIATKIEATPFGIVGRLNATSVTMLTQRGDDTHIRYAIDVSLTGKLGALGQAVLKAKAKEMEKQFCSNLRRALEPQVEGMP